MAESIINLNFDTALAANYVNKSQKVRVMSESWLVGNAYCVRCGHSLVKKPNNNPGADSFCPACLEEFEIKCARIALKNRILDGAFESMIKKYLLNWFQICFISIISQIPTQ